MVAQQNDQPTSKPAPSTSNHFLQSINSVIDVPPQIESSLDPDDFKTQILPLLETACFDCHGPDTQEGNVRIDTLDPDLLHGADVQWWLEIQGALSKGEMPPPDEGELSDQNRGKIIHWLSDQLQQASKVRRATAGHSSFRRLTRYEYNYAMQDLLGLPWDFARDLPPDAASADGFENSSDALHMSVMQLEMYRRLAHKALTRATVTGTRPPELYWGVTMNQAARIDWPKLDAQLAEVTAKFPDDPAQQEQERQRLIESFQQTPPSTHFRNLTSQRNVVATWNYDEAKYAIAPTETLPVVPTDFDQIAVLPAGRQKLTIELGDRLPDEGTLRVRVLASQSVSASDKPSTNQSAYCPTLQLEFGWQASNEGRALLPVSDHDTPIEATSDAPQFYQWDIPLGEIYPRNMVRGQFPMGAMPSPSEYIKLVNNSLADNSLADNSLAKNSLAKNEIHIYYVEVTAPVYPSWPPESHLRIFPANTNDSQDRELAEQILTSFMQRAWRRPIEPSEVQQKLKLFAAMLPQTDSFQEAIIEVLATVLSSPDFLYLVRDHNVDSNQTAEQSTAPRVLSAHELATRLSMFLWCSIPDESLRTLADNNQLNQPEILAAQVQRMLKDPRSRRFSQHFVQQWLDMQLLEFLNQPGLDPILKEAMQREPIAYFQEMLNNNDSVLKFIDSDYAMVNQRLAQHYGLPNVLGNDFRRVSTGDSKRGGLLTQAGLLAMNSNGTDSHPLKRGVWLLESILNDPPPPPPPAVPQIDLADPEIAKMTLKERIENHRNHAACYSCHSKIDPWGIAFENYDATGRWRDQINGKPVEASSELFNHQQLDGVDGLKQYLLKNRQDQVVRAIVYKLATYGLGRPLTFADHEPIDRITAQARQEGDGLTTIIQLLVNSDLFQSE